MFGLKLYGVQGSRAPAGYLDVGSAFSSGASLLGGMAASDAQSNAAQSAADTSAAASRYAADLQKQMYEQTRADQTPWRQTGQNALAMLSQKMGLGSVNPYSQYYGMSREQIRQALAPQYTQQQTQAPTNALVANGLDPNLVVGAIRGMLPLQTLQQGYQQAGINEAGLNSRINEIMQGLQGYNPNAQDQGSLMRDFSMADYQQDPGYGFRLSEGLKAIQNSAAARGGLLSGAALKGISRYGQDMASQEYQNAYNRYQANQANQYNRLANIAGLGQTANNALQTAGQNYATGAGNIALQNAGNVGTAQLLAGQSRASAYGGIGNALGRVNWGSVFQPKPSIDNYGDIYADVGGTGGYNW